MKRPRARARALATALLVPLALGACSHMLDVTNPAVIEEGQLGSKEMVDVMANGIEAQFQRTFNTQVFYMSVMSDELIDGHSYEPEHQWDTRNLSPTQTYVQSQYAAVHALRGVADSLGTRMQNLLGDEATSSLAMAKARVYAGYAFVMLGENFCQSPINGSAPYSDDELLAMAVDRFNDAISIAQAAKAAGGDATTADQLLNLARVGAARASLDAGKENDAVKYAEQVPADFVFWAPFSENSDGQNNLFWNPMQSYDPTVSGVRWIGLEGHYVGLNDLRIPQTSEKLSMIDTRQFYVPFQPSSFSGWVSGDTVPFTKSDFIRVASGLEARYIVQEVKGPTLDFLNERRAVGGQPALTSLPADPMAELRDQRRRDLFMDGHRFADMRRYQAQYGIDLFETGPYEDWPTMSYGDATCIPIAQNEINSNPNL